MDSSCVGLAEGGVAGWFDDIAKVDLIDVLASEKRTREDMNDQFLDLRNKKRTNIEVKVPVKKRGRMPMMSQKSENPKVLDIVSPAVHISIPESLTNTKDSIVRGEHVEENVDKSDKLGISTVPVNKKRSPMVLKWNEDITGCALDRVLKQMKSTTLPVLIGDILEISPACRVELGKYLRPSVPRENNILNIEDKYADTFIQDIQHLPFDAVPAVGKLYCKIAGENVIACIDPGADISMIHPITLNRTGYVANELSKSTLSGICMILE